MPHEVVWVAYEKKSPHLPVCVADSAEELAERMGVSVSTVCSAWSRFWRGQAKSTRYAMVFVEKEDNGYQTQRGLL